MRVAIPQLACAVAITFAFAPAGRAAESIAVGRELQFESATATLTAESAHALDAAAREAKAALDSGGFSQLRIEGHTDSVGDADANLRLSQQRADVVASALVQRGIKPALVVAIGFGELRPVADEATGDGARRRNRRVDLRLLKKDEIDTHVATVARVLNEVSRRAPSTEQWARAAVQDPLFEAWRLQSAARSAADVSFTRDGSQIHVRENTVVVIFGPGELLRSSERPLAGKVSLERGALKSRLAELTGTAPAVVNAGAPDNNVEVVSAAAVATFSGAEVLMNVDAAGTTRLSHHRGTTARVRSARAVDAPVITVAEGFGTAVAPGADPTPPTPLPTPPHALAPALGDGVFDLGEDGIGRILARWEHRADIAGYHVELSRVEPTPPVDGNAGQAPRAEATTRERRLVLADVVDIAAPVSAFQASGLPAGRYQLRVSAIDQRGFEGIPSEPVLLTLRAAPPAAPDAPPAPPQEGVRSTDTALWDLHPAWSVVPFAAGAALATSAVVVALNGVGDATAPAAFGLSAVATVSTLVGVALLAEGLRVDGESTPEQSVASSPATTAGKP